MISITTDAVRGSDGRRHARSRAVGDRLPSAPTRPGDPVPSSATDDVDRSAHSDAQLLRALAEDRSVLGSLYDRHGGFVYGLALAILKNQHEAEDVTQEVFLMLCSSTAFDADRGSLRAFLTTVVRSRAIDRWRRRTRSPARPG